MRRKGHQRIAAQVMVFFAEYRLCFQEITLCAQEYFEAADWQAIQSLSAERIDLYEEMVQEAATSLAAEFGDALINPDLWHQAKQYYTRLILQRTDPELAETFYNSVYCSVFKHHHIDGEHMFIRSSLVGNEINSGDQIFKSYSIHDGGLVNMLKRMMDDYTFNIPWENKRRDIRNLVQYVRQKLPDSVLADQETTVEIVKSVFYRNKAAYIVGRVHFDHSSEPFVIAVLNNENGALYIDTALSDENDVSVVFSFTRSYFLVDINVPSEFIRFLNTLIPAKSKPELYSSIGFYKQGKAEFYRNLVDHLEISDDEFVIAPGIKGMVMTVFTLPSFPVVFKIIKDRFSSSKQITRDVVKQKYQLVKRHDRVGRMADTQEFTNFSFPRERFSEELIIELKKVAASSLEITEDEVVIKHLWTERYMTPLNIYIDNALERGDETALINAINEFGKAIKQLAAANIFAGDMLFKNFGVTRHGRVVFYDYDEIMYLTECNFRVIPEPMYPEQELADEPWYSVGLNDVFPEEFSMLTACNRKVRKIFSELHGDLMGVAFWKEMQSQVKEGDVVDVFPYRKINRFQR
ncbi:bifunctional isocitrate dehydrogenase kinase/phosphatase [Neptuniibacter sp.]|uniref:bifunctional isocitrate dehydrogenase kinase/phosphatase n=1 Tax=Neptuniibacter sp. TaxID=1962643 RepID=UPI0026217EF1|nr:bifunctional isocitrate dehydrogenase kinase/phosphatase [Neptuniibacter sp.]MCP4597381.1 bifunctional isocitrate dehydrogenase kinase/phosphatase [Neptuniibacter sp.]